VTISQSTKLPPVPLASTFAVLIDREPLLRALPNQLTRSPVTMGVMMYSRSEACDGRLKLSVSVCHNGLGRIEILRNGYSATGIGFGRMLNVTRYWVDAAAEGRRDDSVGIDEGCQSEEEYGSGEGLGEHFNNEWIKERRMAAGSARDRL
jgi:hypothetical protein